MAGALVAKQGWRRSAAVFADSQKHRVVALRVRRVEEHSIGKLQALAALDGSSNAVLPDLGVRVDDKADDGISLFVTEISLDDRMLGRSLAKLDRRARQLRKEIDQLSAASRNRRQEECRRVLARLD